MAADKKDYQSVLGALVDSRQQQAYARAELGYAAPGRVANS